MVLLLSEDNTSIVGRFIEAENKKYLDVLDEFFCL
jgi:hypothetical protein